MRHPKFSSRFWGDHQNSQHIVLWKGVVIGLYDVLRGAVSLMASVVNKPSSPSIGLWTDWTVYLIAEESRRSHNYLQQIAPNRSMEYWYV